MAGASLAEPQVLAATKARLFPEPDEPNVYAVTDTQFAMEEWLPGVPISPAVRERLAPFNHVRIGSGYPDLVGVRSLESDLLAVERVGDQPPLIAVEAKGYASGGVDVERGIVQAYDRLHEANAAYVAAPVEAVGESSRTLARELNVGVLGVDGAGRVEALEVPRVVGNRHSEHARAIRFQSSAQGVAGKSFSLNHPKNYLAVPLALYHSEDAASAGDPLVTADDLLATHVVGATDAARQGAAFLGLIESHPTRTTLTPLGEEVVRFALERYGSVDAGLRAFEDWQGSRTRFVDLAPEWGLLARRVVWAYPATTMLVEELQDMYRDDIPDPSLVDLLEWLHVTHPTFAVELFLRGTDDVRARVLDGDGDLRFEELADGNVYHAPTVFQLKAMLYHAGILAERGAEPHRLEPLEDSWRLREPLGECL